MNKLTIPAILVATVMVAGIFAFMPVQQASTVHTTSTMTVSSATIALVADEMLEIREISVTNVDYDGAQAITITGAAATDEFTLLALIVDIGTAGGITANDQITFDVLTVDGAIGALTTATDVTITTSGAEIISEVDITTPTGNVIAIAMTAGTTFPADGETLDITAKILIRNSASDPVIDTL